MEEDWMEKIVIFGTGEYGKKAYRFFENKNEYEIVGICDSNQEKAEKKFFDNTILMPKDVIANTDFDTIVLCASQWETMLPTVSKYGVDINKIKIWNGGKTDLKDSYNRCIHSQDGEELYLKERFNNKKNGIYVDAGAFHPIRYSNTLWAYEMGWNGINIEPNPNNIELFNILRQRDININCGVSDNTTDLRYYRFNEGAINTFNVDRVRYLESMGHVVEDVLTIPVVTLQNIFDQYKVEKVDFLDIDVETKELEVLRGIDFRKVDIDVILVEQLDLSLSEVLCSDVARFLKKYDYIPKQKFHRTVIYER